ncbi:hypothetical protein [Bacillus sp. FJAT-29814]|uniref:AbiJ-related protein n=1 Tax=Bacillus sp. FJAT-29814 TaxID=1729688 RepID=UPI0008346C24|nr:hypothetical protein [Bacillus sp. FJAT-29814]
MKSINELIDGISSILKEEEKSYDLPHVCVRYGLESGDEAEANSSKRVYVQRRLKSKDKGFLIELAKKIIKDYGSSAIDLVKIVQRIDPTGLYAISEITRKNIMDDLYLRGNIHGKSELIEFLKRIWDLENMPSTDARFRNALGDISQHVINNPDWDDNDLFENCLKIFAVPDETFIHFLEQVVHPSVRQHDEQTDYIKLINYHLVRDGFQIVQTDSISGYPVFKINNVQGGVQGIAKNIIFAAVGAKPEIVIIDSINNDIKIVKNEKNCLVYDLPIPSTGLLWNDLVKWWAGKKNVLITDIEIEQTLYKRLASSLDSEPEKTLFFNYYKFFKNELKENFPALIPQVYLHYDPYTIKQRKNSIVLPRQRMDFLLLLPNKQRVVLEVDGKQHYSDGDISSPKKYSEMVSADRELRLNGYEVYRFGGFELVNAETNIQMIKDFFERLFIRHSIKVE